LNASFFLHPCPSLLLILSGRVIDKAVTFADARAVFTRKRAADDSTKRLFKAEQSNSDGRAAVALSTAASFLSRFFFFGD